MLEIKKDFVVCGGGFAGICAAVAAARHGLSVALINDRPVLGGNGSSEIRVGLSGAAGGHSTTIYASEGGIIDEIKLELAKYGERTPAIIDTVLFDIIYREQNIELFLNTLIFDVETDDNTIKSIYAKQLGTEKQYKFISHLFADCTGDAIVGYLAGAEYRYGREAKSEFNESLAPEIADDKVMGGSILFGVEEVDKPVKFIKPEFAIDFEKAEFMKNINAPGMYRDIVGLGGQWWLEYGGQCDTISDNEEIAFKLRSIVLGYWDYIKNSGKFPEAQNYRITYISSLVGKRESRRLIGDYILNQNDIERKTKICDGVAVGGWKLDLHAPGGIYDNAPATSWSFVDGNYMIPYRCLYSRNISNLFMAGRNVSVTHAALSSTRVMCTGAAMGQAVGTAAALCKKYQDTPRGIYKKHMSELRSVLKYDDQAMMGYTLNNHNNIKGITATSYHQYENTNVCKTMELNNNICISLPIITKKVNSMEIALKNKSNTNQKIEVVILNGEQIETYRPNRVIKKTEIELPFGFDGWAKLDIDAETLTGHKIYIVLEKNENIELYSSDDKLTGVENFKYYKKGEKNHHDLIPLEENTGYCNYERIDASVCFKNVEPKQEMYSPDMLINGFDRPYGMPNCWISESKDDQKIEVCLKEKTEIKDISVVFSTPLDKGYFYGDIPKLVKDYQILFLQDEEIVKKINVKQNYQRCNRHNLSSVYADKIVFIPLENYGADYYEIYQLTVNGGEISEKN